MKKRTRYLLATTYRELVIILILLLLSFPAIYAQSNLLLNPSFESYDICKDLGAGVFYGRVTYWYPGNFGSTDYYNSCINDSLEIGSRVPLNGVGFEYPKTGKGYVGIVPHQNQIGVPSYREYAEGTLGDTLIANQKYILSFYISNGESISKFACFDNFGMYFSDSLLQSTVNEENLLEIPQFQNPIGNLLNKRIGWQRVEGTYTAHGGEKYIVLGNFENNANTRVYDCFGTGITSTDFYLNYIYIDDVSIIDTSIIDTVNLCFDDSIQIGDFYAKNTGMYYDTVEDLVARTYVQMRPFSASYMEVDVPYHRGDTVKVGTREFCYSSISQEPIRFCDSLVSGVCRRIRYLWATPDTFFDEKYSNYNGCDSTVRYIIRTNVGIHDPSSYKNGSVSIYPNPASNSIQVACLIVGNATVSKEMNIEILDALGRNCSYKILGKSTNSSDIIFNIDISELSAGMYFTRILNKENKVIGNGRFICR